MTDLISAASRLAAPLSSKGGRSELFLPNWTTRDGSRRQTTAQIPSNIRLYSLSFFDKSALRQIFFVTYYNFAFNLTRWCGVDLICISNVRLLGDAIVAALRGPDGNQACSALSHETVEAALVAFTPSLVVVDATHPEGVALVAAVRARAPKASVIVLAMRDQDEDFLAWADIGISGYLGPDTSAGDLLSVVHRVAAGEVACPPRLTALLLNRLAARSTERMTRAGIFSLTTREREIAELLADGLSNKLIARRLQCALPTVKNHVHSILDKWDCRSRGEAAARYRQQTGNDIKPSDGTVVELRASHVSQMGGATVRNDGLQHRAPAAFSRKTA